MPQFLALTSRGLSDVLEKEIQSLDLKVVKKNSTNIVFESNWKGCYLANLKLRTATRILLPILDFPAYQPDDVYHNILKHDFTKYITPQQTMMVEASVSESSIRDQRIVALKVKDAIADQFTKKFGVRPDVNKFDPDLKVVIKITKNEASVSVDTSGDTLSKRGYRPHSVEAPLREHLAAGLLELSEWDKETVVVDPMCGSGTFLIEAALMAKKVAPGTMRKKFAFQKFLGFQEAAWDEVLANVLEQESESPIKFYGFDINGKAIENARRNAVIAGVDDMIEFRRTPVELIEHEIPGPGIVIVNPPYGERLHGDIIESYENLAYSLKNKFKGWTCWLLSGDEDLTRYLKMKSSRRIQIFNGPIECRFLKYQVH